MRPSELSLQLVENRTTVLLFRGLCPVTTSLIDRSRSTPRDIKSALFVPYDQLMNPVWQHVSAFALNEFWVNHPSDTVNTGILNTGVLNTIAQHVRASMTNRLRIDGAIKPWWKGSAKETYDGLWLVMQQRYTGSDPGFMSDWSRFIAACRKAKERAVILPDPQQTDANLLKVWSWASNPRDFKLPRHPSAHILHGNPHVSTAKRVTHVLRYAAGLKRYMQGSAEGTVPRLEYGLIQASVGRNAARYIDPIADNGLTSEEAYKLPHTQSGMILGVVVLFAMPVSELAQKYVVDQNEQEKLAINPRIISEAEVSFYGHIDPMYVKYRFELRVLNFDYQSVLTSLGSRDANSQHYIAYGICKTTRDPRQCPTLSKIRKYISKMSVYRSRSNEKKTLIEEQRLRAYLAELMQQHIALYVRQTYQFELDIDRISV